MARNPTWLAVVAGVIRDAEGRLLLQQALPGKPHAGQWEFPGGKVEDEENPRFALQRELAEELALEIDPAAMRPAGFADSTDSAAAPAIVLILYECQLWQGRPQAREGQQWGWFTLAEAATLAMPPADRQLLAGLRS